MLENNITILLLSLETTYLPDANFPIACMCCYYQYQYQCIPIIGNEFLLDILVLSSFPKGAEIHQFRIEFLSF